MPALFSTLTAITSTPLRNPGFDYLILFRRIEIRWPIPQQLDAEFLRCFLSALADN